MEVGGAFSASPTPVLSECMQAVFQCACSRRRVGSEAGNYNSRGTMKPYIGSIDQGTSSTRFILFSKNGQQVASHQVEFKQYYPRKGESWVEHDAEEIMQSVFTCIDTVMKNFDAKDVAAIGITNQRETTVLWDSKTGKPLHRALVWLDNRTSAICDRWEKKFGSKDHFRSTCGLPISTYFSASKIKWLMENSKQVQAAIAQQRCMFGTIESWLLYNLSGGAQGGGVHLTDVTNASRTMLMDLRSRTWSQSVCDALEIPMHILPAIRSNSEVYANVATGVLKGVPIASCVGDQQSAMIGQLCLHKGNVKNTYGTGCFMLMNTGTDVVDSTHGLLSTACFQLGADAPTYYALEGSVAVAGVAIKWMRDNLKMYSSAKEVSELAATIPDSAGMYFVPAFSGLFAPYWRMDARGVFVGLSFEHNRAHFARSALEAVCYRSREVMDAMNTDSKGHISSLRVDGGMAASDPMLQFQADILDIDVARPAMLETTALGCALAAGLAVGVYSSVKDMESSVHGDLTHFRPKMSNAERAKCWKGWKRAVGKALNWVEHDADDEKEDSTQTKSNL